MIRCHGERACLRSQLRPALGGEGGNFSNASSSLSPASDEQGLSAPYISGQDLGTNYTPAGMGASETR